MAFNRRIFDPIHDLEPSVSSLSPSSSSSRPPARPPASEAPGGPVASGALPSSSYVVPIIESTVQAIESTEANIEEAEESVRQQEKEAELVNSQQVSQQSQSSSRRGNITDNERRLIIELAATHCHTKWQKGKKMNFMEFIAQKTAEQGNFEERRDYTIRSAVDRAIKDRQRERSQLDTSGREIAQSDYHSHLDVLIDHETALSQQLTSGTQSEEQLQQQEDRDRVRSNMHRVLSRKRRRINIEDTEEDRETPSTEISSQRGSSVNQRRGSSRGRGSSRASGQTSFEAAQHLGQSQIEAAELLANALSQSQSEGTDQTHEIEAIRSNMTELVLTNEDTRQQLTALSTQVTNLNNNMSTVVGLLNEIIKKQQK